LSEELRLRKFSGSFFAATGSTLSVVLGAFAGRVFSDAASSAASAYIDPLFQIDPIWAESHSGYSLQFESGVGDGAPARPARCPSRRPPC
jgi:hypothetical protein